MARHKGKPQHEDPAGLDWQDRTPERRGGHEAAVKALEQHRGPGDKLGALTHGAHLAKFGARPCRGCPVRDRCELHDEEGRCEVEVRFLADRHALIVEALAEDGEDVALAEPLINVALDADLRLRRRQRALSVTGDFLAGVEDGYAELQPAAKDLPSAYRAVERAYDNLNLSPRSRAKLKADDKGGGFLKILEAAKRIEERQRAEAQDAEFTAADEDAPGEGEAGSWAWGEGEDEEGDEA